MIKYILHPRKIRDRPFKPTYFVSYLDLVAAYKLNPNECISANDANYDRDLNRIRGYTPDQMDCILHLYPTSRQNYCLDTAKVKQLMEAGMPDYMAKNILNQYKWDFASAVNWYKSTRVRS